MNEREIFLAALELATPETRAAYLQGACGQDATLRRKVEELLKEYFSNDNIAGESALQQDQPTVKRDIASDAAPAQMLGRYKLLEKIGEGGFGEVWMAEQREPVKRRVALKIIKLGMDSRQIVNRFAAERQALAMMDHANIAKIFDADVTDSGRPYFVMELVRGVKITEYCDQNQLPTHERLRLFILVCQAIQHAHQKGIIHRDIKPSNILVTLHDGVPMPKVIDFGIAKATQQELTDKTVFTQFQQFLGTPTYISPEQAEMSGLDIDTRADIYSLGVLLYELLVGQTPFDAQEMMQGGLDALRQIIREREPLRPSTKLNSLVEEARTTVGKRRQTEVGKLVHQLEGDLDWIVMKCLEKDRTRRYDTANGLGMDIQRHLSHEPVVARPPSTAYRFQKAWQRNKLVFTAGAAVAAALIVGIGVSTWQAIRATRAEWEQSGLRRSAEEARQSETLLRHEAQAQESVARRTSYNSEMNLAQQALQLNNIGRALKILNRHRPKPGESDLRGWEWRYLWRFCQSDAVFTLCRQSNAIFSVSFSSDGKFLAVADATSEVTVWDLATRKGVMSRGTGVHRQRIAFSPVTNQLAFSEKGPDSQRTVKLWDAGKGQDVMQWLIPDDGRESVFARDGSSLAAWSLDDKYPQSDSRIFLWDIPSGRKLFEIGVKRGGRGMGNLLALSDRSQILAYGSAGGEIVVIDVAAGREKSRLHVTEEFTMAVAISRDGKLLASAAGFTDPVVKLWDLDTGKEAVRLEGHRSYVNALAFSPDRPLLASASGDQTIRIWDWRERRPLMTLRGHSKEVLDVAFAPDGQMLASGCKDGTVLMWNIASHRDERTYEFLPIAIRDWAFTPDSRVIFGLDDNGAVRSWTTTALQENRRFEALGTNNTSFALSKSGTLLAVSTSTGRAQVINCWTGVEVGSFMVGSGRVRVVGFFEDNLLLARDQDMRVSLWDIRTGQRKHQWQIPEPFESIQLAHAADVLVTQHEDQLTLWRAKDGQRLWTVKAADEPGPLEFSHDGKVVAVPSGKGFAKLFDTRNGTELATLGGLLLGAHSVAFSADDQRLALGSNGKEGLKVWDTELRQEVLTLEGEGSIFFRTAFSPDGRLLGSASRKGLHLWSAPSWEEIAAAEAKEKTESKQP